MDTVEEVIAHFGVKGMKWGVRRAERKAQRHEAMKRNMSEDAINAGNSYAKLRKKGIQSLSNQELQTVVNRMNLEQQYGRLKASQPSRFAKGHAAVKTVLGVGKTAVDVHNLVNNPSTKLGAKIVTSAFKKGKKSP